MNAYPAEFVQQHHPLMLVGGLLEPTQSPPASTSALSQPTDAFPQLCTQLVKLLSSKGRSTAWDPNSHRGSLLAGAGSGSGTSTSGAGAGLAAGARAGPTFRTILVPDNFRLPPRKIRLQAPPSPSTARQSLPDDGATQQGTFPPAPPPPAASGAGQIMRSALSPLHPHSPLYPDGLISPLWVRKHRDVIPSIFVLFQVLPLAASSDQSAASAADQQQQQTQLEQADAALIKYISNLRALLTARSIKLTVVLLTSRASLAQPTLEPRLSHLRRTSGLDSKGSLFVLTPVSEPDLHDFINSLQNALAEASTDYYREQGRRVRRKRGKYPPPVSAYGSPDGSPPGSGPPVSPLTKEGWSLRSAYKLGTFAELSGDLSLSLEHYVNAYDVLSSTAHPHNGGLLGDTRVLPPRTKRWAEAKALADGLVVRIARGWLLLGLEAHTFTVPSTSGEQNGGEIGGDAAAAAAAAATPGSEKTRQIQIYLPSREAWERALSVFRAHLKRFEELSNGWGMGVTTGEWWSWVGKQYRLYADLVDSIVRSYRHAPMITLSQILPEHCPPLPSNLLHPTILPTYSAALAAATSGVSRAGPGQHNRNDSIATTTTSTSTGTPARSSTLPSGFSIDSTGPGSSAASGSAPLSLATSLALTLSGPSPLAPSPLASKSGIAPATGVLPHPGQWYLLAALCAEERWRRWRAREEREREAGSKISIDDPSTAAERKANHASLVIEALTRAYECFKRPVNASSLGPPASSSSTSGRSRTASYVAARMAHAYLLSGQNGLALSFAQRILVPFRGNPNVNPSGTKPAPGRSEGILLDLLVVGATAAARLEEEALKADSAGGLEADSGASEIKADAAGTPGADADSKEEAPSSGSDSDKGQAASANSSTSYRVSRVRFLWEALCVLSHPPQHGRHALLEILLQEFQSLLSDATPLPAAKDQSVDAVVLESSVAAHGAPFRVEAVFWDAAVEVGESTRVQVRVLDMMSSTSDLPAQPRWNFERLEVDIGLKKRTKTAAGQGFADVITFTIEHAAGEGSGVVELGKETSRADLSFRTDLPLTLEGAVQGVQTGPLQVLEVRLFPAKSPLPYIIKIRPFVPDLIYAGLPARQAVWYVPSNRRFVKLDHRLSLSECTIKPRTYKVSLSTANKGTVEGQESVPIYLHERYPLVVQIENQEISTRGLEGVLSVSCGLSGLVAEDGSEPGPDLISCDNHTSDRELFQLPLGTLEAGQPLSKVIYFQANSIVGPRQLSISLRVRPTDPGTSPDSTHSNWELADEKTEALTLDVQNPFESVFSLAWSQEQPVTSAAEGNFLSAEDEVFVHPDGSANGAIARLSAELGLLGRDAIVVESTVVHFTNETVRTYGSPINKDRFEADWTADFAGEWGEGDRCVGHVKVEVARDATEGDVSSVVQDGPGAGHIEIQWRRVRYASGTPEEGSTALARTLIPLPGLVPPPAPTVSIVLHPPSFARLGQPFVLRAIIKNEQAFRTANVRVEVESSDVFVFAGPRRLTVPALLPRSERKVVWRLVARQTGWVDLPTVRAEDGRARSTAEHEASSSAGLFGAEESGPTGGRPIPERSGGPVPVYDGRRLGTAPVIYTEAGSSTTGTGAVGDLVQEELRQAMSSPPLPVPASVRGRGSTTGIPVPPPSVALAEQRGQVGPKEGARVGAIRAPGRCIILVLP